MQTENLYSLMQKGGAVMWPLYALLVATVVIALERTITFLLLWKRGETLPLKRLEGPLSVLDLVSMISPVLGFLGTVTGMINAFKSVSEAVSVQLQVVASGLYEALFTTAFGLIVSIIATILGFLLDMAAGALCEKDET
ncbi:MAG: MotA/TolQ/ExbB proton channel family protein [Sphaerochaeta sp.]|nr:MotA/TolQ/ExbB proton channel family protein [Sphaerochaeta sp.]